MEVSTSFGRKNEEGRKVKQTLDTFRNLSNKLFCQYKEDNLYHFKARTKALMEAAMFMKSKHQWKNTHKCVGHVPGIEVGDRFQYRAELIVVGLHHQFSSGIDYLGKGRDSLATSIVVTKRYDNIRDSSGSLIYIGHGGNPNVRHNFVPRDQKLEGGNLALKNSMDAKTLVRVILKVCKTSSNGFFFYDGLYLVEKMTQERGEFEKLVFKFTLKRILEQPRTCVSPKDVNNSGRFASFTQRKRHKSIACVTRKDVVRVNDISNGQEKFAIRVVTASDSDQMPPSFDYIVNRIYSKSLKLPILCACGCADECVGSDDECVGSDKCACNVKNGGSMLYDHNKRLASPLKSPCIYECGPSCKCSSSCINRVSQVGIQFQFEIFETELKGWGVRTRSFIPAGSFVCEYIGEVCHYRDADAGSRLDDDSYVFHLGASSSFIDATRFGNIGRFINHSCSPNLHVKDIMHDHNDKIFPHKVLFALKDIAAGRELSYDYNCRKGRIFKFESDSCHCGSQECIGHIYTSCVTKGQ